MILRFSNLALQLWVHCEVIFHVFKTCQCISCCHNFNFLVTIAAHRETGCNISYRYLVAVSGIRNFASFFFFFTAAHSK
jgi:hypothetical protein